MTARTLSAPGDLLRTRPEGVTPMTQQTLLVPPGTGDSADIPALTAAAAVERAVQDYAPPAAAVPAHAGPVTGPAPLPETAPAAEDSGQRLKIRLHRRAPRKPRERGNGFIARAAAGGGMLLALAVVTAAAGWLTFPHVPPFNRVHGSYAAALVSAGAIAAIIGAIAAWRAAQRALEGRKSADMLTILAATIATIVSATGMWAFFAEYVPSIEILVRVPIFAFLEVSTLASAIRARDNMRERVRRAAEGHKDEAGIDIDALAMWVFTGISAVLASMASTTPAEAVFRLAPPLVAAWLWERALRSEKKRIDTRRGKTEGITWRIDPQRLLVQLGLAEPGNTSLSEVAAQRHIMRTALAAEKLSSLEAIGYGPDSRQWQQANQRLRSALRKTAQQTDLARSPERRAELQTQIAILTNPHQLLALDVPSPWEQSGSRRTERPTAGPKDEKPKPKPREKTAAPVPFEELAASLRQALGRQDGEAIHQILAGRSDYAVIARQLGKRAAFGDKRLLTLVSLYAAPEGMASPIKAIEWAASVVLGQAGQLDKKELRTIRTLLEPVWATRDYNPPA